MNSLVKTLRQDQNAKLADFEEMEKYRVGFEKTSGLIEAERERNNQACFHFLSDTIFLSTPLPFTEVYHEPPTHLLRIKMKTFEAQT